MDNKLKDTIDYNSIWIVNEKKTTKYYCDYWEVGGGLVKAQITKSTYDYLKRIGLTSKSKIKTITED